MLIKPTAKPVPPSFRKDPSRPSTYVQKEGAAYDELFIPVIIWNDSSPDICTELYVSEPSYTDACGLRGTSSLLAIRTLLKGAYELEESSSIEGAVLVINGHGNDRFCFKKVREAPPIRSYSTNVRRPTVRSGPN